MKKTLILIGLSVCLVGRSADYFENFTNGLVAYYPLQNDTLDYSLNGRDMTSTGNLSFTTNRFGQLNSAAVFDGSTYCVENNQNDSLMLSATFTVSCWVNIPSGQSVWMEVINKDFDIDFGVGFNQVSGSPLVGFADCFPSTSYDVTYWSVASLSGWTQLVATFDGVGFRFYQDGKCIKKVVFDQSTPQNPTSTWYPLTLGKDLNFGLPFTGILSDVRVYNRALALDEVVRLHNWENQIQTLPPYNR